MPLHKTCFKLALPSALHKYFSSQSCTHTSTQTLFFRNACHYTKHVLILPCLLLFTNASHHKSCTHTSTQTLFFRNACHYTKHVLKLPCLLLFTNTSHHNHAHTHQHKLYFLKMHATTQNIF